MPDRAVVAERKEPLQRADDSQSKPANPLQEPRAVVDVMCPNCESLEECGQGFPTPSCKMCDGTGCLNAKPQPRATSALSEDRQWLVVSDDGQWMALELSSVRAIPTYTYRWSLWDDTGQDAHAVLADFLRNRQ